MKKPKCRNSILIPVFLLILTISGCMSVKDLDFLKDMISSNKESENPSDTESETERAKFFEQEVEEQEPLPIFPLDYYYYNLLEEEEKHIYYQIYDGLLHQEKEITVDLAENDKFLWFVDMVLYDHPEIFWLENGYQYTTYNTYIVMEPKYSCEGEEKNQKQGQIDQVVNQILVELNAYESQYEKIKYVFEYLVKNVDYVEGSSDNQNMYSALVNGQSVCAGYAKATQYILQQAGMETLFVTGQITDSGSHAWNIVKCDGKYYHVDTTFGDSGYQNELLEDESALALPEEFQCIYNYLCCSDVQIYRNRTADEDLKLPVCDSDELNYYALNGLYFETYSDEVKNCMYEEIQGGSSFWMCQFSNQEAYQEALDAIASGLYSDMAVEYLYQTSGIYEVQTYYAGEKSAYIIVCWYED